MRLKPDSASLKHMRTYGYNVCRMELANALRKCPYKKEV